MRDLINHFEHKNATKTTINFKRKSKHIILVFFFYMFCIPLLRTVMRGRENSLNLVIKHNLVKANIPAPFA